MSGDQVQILVAMCIYLVAVIGIGLFYMKTAMKPRLIRTWE